ncbi:WD40 repeat-like protein, partial [Aureobasidium melanogenum]
MDIHRCRFVPYPPHSINALAFSHSSDPKRTAPSDLRLAVGRNNGDIELWNPRNGLWVQETIIRGSKDATIEQLAWTQDIVVDDNVDGVKLSQGPLRLFSIAGTSSVTEWDLNTGSVKRRAEGNTGDIWCFAAQPQIERVENVDTLPDGAASQLLAAGCSNGTVVLFSTEDDELRYLRTLLAPPVRKPKALSITWRDRNTVVVGYEDSTIRVIDVPSRKILRNMSLGKPVDGNHSVVWTVKCLPDGSIVSGDSSGELKIWDPKNYSLIQRVKSHKADILDIAVSPSGDTIFSLGVDRRTVTYKPVATLPGTKKTRWAEVAHRRYHQHDVKCSASFESKELSVLVSGGMDARPVVIPIRRSHSELHRTLPHLPQKPPMSSSPTARLFISWWDREIMVYHVRKQKGPGTNFDVDPSDDSAYETLARLVMQGDENLHDAKVSEDGKFIVAATSSSVKLFQLRKTQVSGRPCLRTRQIDLPPAISRLGSRCAGFSPDSKWLYMVRKDNTVVLAKILVPEDHQKERPTIHEKTVRLYRSPRKTQPSALGLYHQTITQVAFSNDSRVLAVGDLSGAVDVWILEGHEDLDYVEAASESDSDDKPTNASVASSSSSSSSGEEEDESPVVHGQKWVRNPAGSQFPQLDSSILILTFRPSPINKTINPANGNLGLHATRHTPHPVSPELPATDHKLIAVTATHQLVEFDVLTSKLSDWSRRNPSKFLPVEFTRLKDRVVGCFWDSTSREKRGERLWLYGTTWVFMFDVSQDLPPHGPTSTTAANGTSTSATSHEKKGKLGDYDVLEPVDGNDDTDARRKRSAQRQVSGNTKDNLSKKRKRNTGAGDVIPERERQSGVGSSMLKFKNEGDDVQMIDIDAGPADADGGDFDETNGNDDDEDDALALLRRNREKETEHENGAMDSASDSRPAHWHTFSYRSILGISVIGAGAADGPTDSDDHDLSATTAEDNIEVVIVERSMYDVEQLPRFDGGQDWET